MRFAGLGLALLLFPDGAWAADTDFDVTCVNSGTRYRVAIVREVPDRELPCSVQTFEHPIGLYWMNWRVIWRAENQDGFCEAKALEWVDTRRGYGWKCEQTDIWNGRRLRR
ncbi:MAG: hypothetical protein ACR2QH_16390 [Geminicoccaceae bacterium]